MNSRMQSKKMQLKLKGFTLIENIIAMVLMGLAMITLITLLFPFVQRAAEAQMEARAASLSQSVMNTILSYSFDEASDHSGDLHRCDGNDSDGNPVECSNTLGADADETTAAQFDDVDDFIGCWFSGNIQESNCAGVTPSYNLSALMGSAEASSYNEFRVMIAVEYLNLTAPRTIKKIEVSVDTLAFENVDVTLTAYRGNY